MPTPPTTLSYADERSQLHVSRDETGTVVVVQRPRPTWSSMVAAVSVIVIFAAVSAIMAFSLWQGQPNTTLLSVVFWATVWVAVSGWMGWEMWPFLTRRPLVIRVVGRGEAAQWSYAIGHHRKIEPACAINALMVDTDFLLKKRDDARLVLTCKSLCPPYGVMLRTTLRGVMRRVVAEGTCDAINAALLSASQPLSPPPPQ